MYSLDDHLKMALLFPLLYALTLVQGVVVIAEKPSSLDVNNEEITCWRCPNKTNNQNCNDWAPDVPCERNHTVCQTVHRMDVKTGSSLSVNKRCAKPDECTVEMIGCREVSSAVKECTSCCNFAYCNEPVPTNHSTAILYSSIFTSSANLHRLSWQHSVYWMAAFAHVAVSHRTSYFWIWGFTYIVSHLIHSLDGLPQL